jgi:hypothetical protein
MTAVAAAAALTAAGRCLTAGRQAQFRRGVGQGADRRLQVPKRARRGRLCAPKPTAAAAADVVVALAQRLVRHQQRFELRPHLRERLRAGGSRETLGRVRRGDSS